VFSIASYISTRIIVLCATASSHSQKAWVVLGKMVPLLERVALCCHVEDSSALSQKRQVGSEYEE
jgi:hypothetical protein